MNPHRISSRVMAVAWLALFGTCLVGFRTTYLFPIVLGITAVLALLFWRTGWVRVFFETLENWLSFKAVSFFIVVTALSALLANLLEYEALDGAFWDLATYIQAVYREAFSGGASITISGEVASAYAWHLSAAIPLLGGLYRLIPHPWVLIVWQWFFLFLPSFVFLWAYREIFRARGLTPKPLGYLLVYCCSILNPTFAGQIGWAYLFHVAGLGFLALACVFYFKNRPGAWALGLLLFASQKEEFGLFAAAFAGFAGLESVVGLIRKQGDLRLHRRFLWAAAVVFAAGVGEYLWFTSRPGQAVPFSARFWNLGETPVEAARNLFDHPEVYFKSLLRPEVLRFLAFFGLGSLLWLRPRWPAFRFFAPVLPFLLLFSLAGYRSMHALKDHYSLPLLVALLATLVLGVLGSLPRERLASPVHHAYLATALLIFTCFGHPDPVRAVRKNLPFYVDRRADIAAVRALAERRDVLLCCQGRLCTAFADRPLLMQTDLCQRGSPIGASLSGKTAVYLAYQGWDPAPPSGAPGEIPPPQRWIADNPLLRLSADVTIP